MANCKTTRSHRHVARSARALRRVNRDELQWNRAVGIVLDATPAERAAMARRAEQTYPREIVEFVRALAIACEAEDWHRRTH